MMNSKQQRRYNIVILDGHCANPGDLSWEELKEFGQLKIYDRTSQEQVVGRSIDADILLVNKTKITANELQQLPQLKYIGVLATGFNHIDIEAAHKQNVVVSNIPSYSTYSVAQMVFASIFAISNRVEHYAQQTREGKWTQNPGLKSQGRHWESLDWDILAPKSHTLRENLAWKFTLSPVKMRLIYPKESRRQRWMDCFL